MATRQKSTIPVCPSRPSSVTKASRATDILSFVIMPFAFLLTLSTGCKEILSTAGDQESWDEKLSHDPNAVPIGNGAYACNYGYHSSGAACWPD